MEGAIYKMALDQMPTVKGGQRACPFHNCHSGCKAGDAVPHCEFNERKWIHEKVPSKNDKGKPKGMGLPLQMLARRYGNWYDQAPIDKARAVEDTLQDAADRQRAEIDAATGG